MALNSDHFQTLAMRDFSFVQEVRRHLHANPELSFQERETSAYIQSALKSMKIPFKTGYAGYGITAMIGRTSGKIVALRGDMDALPIQEENEVAYCSKNPGVMHACGHDVHTASVLGAAKILKSVEDQLSGRVMLVFQPGEERLPGGASIMIREGAFAENRPDAIFGQHVFPQLEAGKVGFRPGMYMASADEIRIRVKGRGGHGAMPHLNADPVLMASHLVVALQQIVSRNSNPVTPSVLSFGKIEGKGTTNVIPDEVHIEGTFRTFDEAWRSEAHARIRDLSVSLVASMGGKCELQIDKGYPFLVNDEALTNRASTWACEYLGEENVTGLDIRMTAEDFAYYSQEFSGCFYRLGVRNEERGIVHNVHQSRFDIDENALPVGSGLMAWLAARELANG
jgi:amidohydrolase